MKRVALILGLALAVAGALLLVRRPGHAPAASAPTTVSAWSALDAQSRCDRALALVTYPERWPTVCRWRAPGEAYQGQSFPPPKGAPPFDDPHIEIYVAPEQSREELASAMAHELGHMHLTREPTFVPQWLEARRLPADTPPEVWTEDYAEAFAALFGPPVPRWRAPTPRPTPEALAQLKERFFA